MKIEKAKFLDWLEAVQEYYAWNEAEYQRNAKVSEDLAKAINEMRTAVVMDCEP